MNQMHFANTTNMRLTLTSFLFLLIFSCKPAEFADSKRTSDSDGSQRTTAGDRGPTAGANSTGSTSDTAGTTSGASSVSSSGITSGSPSGSTAGPTGGTAPTGGTTSGSPVNPKVGDPTKCYFLVSGSHFGWSSTGGESYGSSFPLPNDGRPIATGIRFDTVGGVFLNARDQPYVQGGGEIDLAIQNTFDSIAVAPGMNVQIKTSATGSVLYSGNGPYMAYSDEHPLDQDRLASLLSSRQTSMPNWMKTYLSTRGFKPPILKLHTAKWVQVTKIPSTNCE